MLVDMDLGLEGRVALVMGSSSGIGLGIAEALAREDARVAVVSRSRERAEEAAATIAGVKADVSTAGATAPFVADTNDLDRLGELPGEVEAGLGPIEILVT
ncbi:MAG: SDR family NAD(P)-dependent oxidoreductase, partial [Mycobacteriales bacterium]